MPWTLSGFTDEAGPATETQIAAAKKAGLRHVDLRTVDGHNISAIPLDAAKASADKLKNAGIKVGMFGSPIGKIDISDDFAKDLERIRHLAKLKPIFHCDRVRIFSYYNKNKEPAAQWQAEVFRRLQELKNIAEQEGLVLYHENEAGIYGEGCARNIQILDAFRDADGNGAFRGIFDFDNYNHAKEDVWENWTKLRDRTDAFHLKDSDKNGQHVPVGQGNGQVRKILADAVARGWTGILSLEPHLAHSSVVMATGPTGVANQALKDMPYDALFQIAADAARKLLADVKARFE